MTPLLVAITIHQNNNKGARCILLDSLKLLHLFHQFDTNDVSADESQPLQKKVLKKAKLKRMKEMKTSEVMTDVLLYSLFLLLLLMVAYGHRDPIAYEMTRNLENRLSLSVRHFFVIYTQIIWAVLSETLDISTNPGLTVNETYKLP